MKAGISARPFLSALRVALMETLKNCAEEHMTKEIQFGPCCFCGRDIEKQGPDPCRITVETQQEKWQTWFTHAECFKERLTRAAAVDLSPAHF
jgi:hypothetical protein